jgi:hypothetical protein
VSGKSNKKKSGQVSRAQQQQAAARRNLAPSNSAQLRPATAKTAPQETQATQATQGTPALSQTKHYLDISAVRIQEWLARTPDLRFRRGASVLLSRVTAKESWAAKLPPGTRWNEEAGSVDGVVSLEFDPAATAAGPAKVLVDAAREVARSMRQIMPHCPIQAVSGTGPTYAAAYPDMAKARRNGDFVIDAPPAPAEVILAKPCDQCRAAAATARDIEVIAKEPKQALCQECNARFEAAGKTGGRPIHSPEPERKLKKALNKALQGTGRRVEDFSDTFADMARAGQRERDDAATQLALIFADGNKVGNFLSVAAKAENGPDKATIAPLIQEATLGALVQAVLDRFETWTRPPVLVNLAGGDDLLVSAPAADAWLFTKTLLATFGELLQEKASAGNWPRELRDQVPTLSAGLVFHHVKNPFSDVVRHATEELKRAKRKAPGTAAVAFLDLTADGSEAPKGRAPITLGDLDKYASRLTKTAELPSSRRQTLLDLERNDPEGFINRLTDFADNWPLWEIAVGGRKTDPQAASDELRKSAAARCDVRRALDIARHWNAEPGKEPSTETR